MAPTARQDLVSLKQLYTPPLIKRIGQAVTYALAGGWFSPGTPMQPTEPQTAGRRFDYVANMNLWIQPKRDTGINFESLRNFARLYDILRICIETRKDQIAAFEWEVVPEDEDLQQEGKKVTIPAEITAGIKKVKDFFKNPDPNSLSLGWDGWLRTIVEDIFVLDAVCLYPTYKGKECVGLPIVDPSTIKIVIDESGRVPQPPYPAFQQVLHGIPASQYRRNELAYFMRNPRSDSIYGYSAVEQIAMTVNIGLRREISQLQYFTEGNIPEALCGVPDSWDGAAIAQYQTWWDSLMEGNTGQRRHLKFVPGDASKIQFSKNIEATLKGEFDEWLARIICYCFSLSPTPFVKQVNRATADTAKDTANEEGIVPLLNYVRGIMNHLIKDKLGVQGVQFRWEIKDDVDPQVQSEIDDVYTRNGTISIDDVRKRIGQEPLGVPNLIFLPSGPIPVAQFIPGSPEHTQAAADAQQQNDLQVMQAKAKVAGPPGGKPGAPPAKKPVAKLEKYNEDQARAENGQFGSGGGPGPHGVPQGDKTVYMGSQSTNMATNNKETKAIRAEAHDHASRLKAAGHENVKVTRRENTITVPGRGMTVQTVYTVHHGGATKSDHGDLEKDDKPFKPVNSRAEQWKDY